MEKKKQGIAGVQPGSKVPVYDRIAPRYPVTLWMHVCMAQVLGIYISTYPTSDVVIA